MRIAAFASLIAAAGLAACASPPPTHAAIASGMGWALYETAEEGVKLAYGEPQSDDVPLMLTCLPGSGRVAVNMSTPAEAPRYIGLVSGPTASRFPAAMKPDPAEVYRMEATGPATAPALLRFATTGELVVQANGSRITLPTLDPRQAAKFMKTCRFG
jgi:hypothetical protein